MTWLLEQRARPLPVRAEREGGREQAEELGDDVARHRPECAGEPAGEARAWAAGGWRYDQEEPWRRLAGRFARTGLWPRLAIGADRLFLEDELLGQTEPPDAAGVLSRGWEGTRLVAPDGTRLPHPPWPGLAAANGVPAGRVGFPWLPLDGGELLLVPATRPADSIARLGWYGACNWSLTGADVAAVLRSWEDRFGAYVVEIGSADEHYAFCPDNFFPQVLSGPGVILPDQCARALRGARSLHFWWD